MHVIYSFLYTFCQLYNQTISDVLHELLSQIIFIYKQGRQYIFRILHIGLQFSSFRLQILIVLKFVCLHKFTMV